MASEAASARRFYCGEAIGSAFRDLKNHFGATFLTAAVLAIPVLFASFFIATGQVAFGFLLQMFASLVIGVWLSGVMMRATWEYATGSDPGVGTLLDRGTNSRLFALAGTYLLLFLIAVGAVLLAFLPFLITVIGTVGGLERIDQLFDQFAPAAILTLIVGLIIAFVLILIVGLRYAVAGQASVLEGAGPVTALQRSSTLMKRHWFDMFLLWLMLFGISLVVGVITNMPGMITSFGYSFERPSAIGLFGEFSVRTTGGPSLPTGAAVVFAISTYLTQIATTPITVIAMTNFYLSLRGEEAAALKNARPEPGTPLIERVDATAEEPAGSD